MPTSFVLQVILSGLMLYRLGELLCKSNDLQLEQSLKMICFELSAVFFVDCNSLIQRDIFSHKFLTSPWNTGNGSKVIPN